MGLKSSLEYILGEVFGYETKEEKQARLEEEEKSPSPKDIQKPASEEEKKEKEREWKDITEDIKYVCQGGKIQCTFCATPIADIQPTSTQVMLQDKPWATTGDKDGKVNFGFTGVCSLQKKPCKAVISLGQWKKYSETMIDDYNALLVKSTIPCMISGQDLKIVHSGQMAELNELKLPIKRERKVVDVYWKEKDCDAKNYYVFPDYPVTLYIETKNYLEGEIVNITVSHAKGKLFKGERSEIPISAIVGKNKIAIVEDFTIEYQS